MSRIGKTPVALPAGVEVTIGEGNVITVKGPKGQLQEKISDKINVEVKDNEVLFSRNSDDRVMRAQHGLARALVHNMVVGVSTGFEKKLQLVGVGYRAEKKGDTLVMSLGYSHPVEMKDPEGITTETPDATTVIVKGMDKGLVGNYCAKIRAWRMPEPYKGKGIKFENEVIRRKEGKTGAK
ncbi:MAG: 50S ribosomal protein L6 [Eubacterium sp.]|nr:50S ribosomal protein L6 [Eubacterium sp.]